MKKEANTLMCSIIYEINSNFMKACLSNKNGAKDVSVKYVESCIRRLIPKDLRAQAFAAGYSEIVRLQTGLIIYKDPKIPKPLSLEPNMFRKGLEQLAQTSHRNLTLSRNCSTIGCIVHKLAVQMTEKTISAVGDKPELALEDLRNVVYSVLGEELFTHAEGHAASNLNWYLQDTLDFTLKPIHSDGTELKVEDESELLPRYIQKLARNQYSVSFTKKGSQTLDKVLKEIADAVLEHTRIFVENKLLQNLSVSEYVMYEVLQNLLPPVMFKMACSYAQGRVLNYSCGMLKYDYKRPAEEPEEVPGEAEEVDVADERVLPDYRRAVKRLMQEYHCRPANGFLPLVNDILNDIGVAFAEICSQNAHRNGDVLSENDVLVAVNVLLPEGLRSHAFARIVHVGRECPSPNRQLMNMLMLVPNNGPCEMDQEYVSPQLTDDVSVASPVEEISVDLRGTDSKELMEDSVQLPHINVSSFLTNERSIAYTHDGLPSPFSKEALKKSNIGEAKLQRHSHTSIERVPQGYEPNEISIEQPSRAPRGSVQSGIVGESFGISNLDVISQSEIPKPDLPADKKPSGEKPLSAPNLSHRASNNLQKYLEERKKMSLQPVSHSNFSKNPENDTLNNLSGGRKMEKGNQDEVLETSKNFGKKQSPAESDEQPLTPFLSKTSKEPNTPEDRYEDNQKDLENSFTVQSGPKSEGHENQTQSSKPSISPATLPESNALAGNLTLQDASSSRDKRSTTHINDENAASTLFGLLQQASNTILYPFQDRLNASKESVAQNGKSGTDDVGLAPNSAREKVSYDNKEQSTNRDSLDNLSIEKKALPPNQIPKSKYSSNDERPSTAFNEENRLSSIFNLLHQASSTLLYPFQDRGGTSQERLQQNGPMSDDVHKKSSSEQYLDLPKDIPSHGSIEKTEAAVSKNEDAISTDTMSGGKQQIKPTEDAHFSSISDYVHKTLKAIEEETEMYEEPLSTSHETESDKLGIEAGTKHETSTDISEVQMKNSNYGVIKEEDDVRTKLKESEIFFLDIPRTIFWIDVKPYDILM